MQLKYALTLKCLLSPTNYALYVGPIVEIINLLLLLNAVRLSVLTVLTFCTNTLYAKLRVDSAT